jgi:heme-degrading monooxygenase HmoA
MINVGLYYRVKDGHESEFESIFREAIEVLRKSESGFVDGKLYKEIGNRGEYLIYTEWKDLESFREFISGRTFKDIQNYGKNILESMPRHRIFREEQF